MSKSFVTKIFVALVCLCSAIIFGRVEDVNAEDGYWGYDYTGVQEMVEILNSRNDQLEEMVVAVLDTGVDSDHEWLEGRIASGGKYCLNNTGMCYFGSYEDDHGHGTHVAGIIAKSTPKNVKILPIKVLDGNNNGWVVDFVAGLNYVVELKKSGVNIVAVNFSIISSSAYEGNEKWHNMYREAFEKVRNEEILAVVCAGNNKVDVAKIVGPSNIENVIAVSSISKINGDVQFSKNFSNFGETIDLSAPGEKIISARLGGGITEMIGTSMSTPYVTASVALLYSICPNCSMEQIENALMEGAVDLGEVGKDAKYGHGALNVINSYNYLKNVVNYKIEAIAEGCGTVNIGQENVHLDGNVKALLLPFYGCEVEKVLVNGEELDEFAMDDAILNGYTFDNINENKTIEVIFDVKTYVVESIVQGNGRASVVGVQMVEHGESLTVKFTPYVGYKVSKILVNGEELDEFAMDDAILNGYTFDNINENKTIEVIFEVKTYVLESTVQGNGRASVVGVQMVEHGESLTVEFTPYVGYKVSKILVNGEELDGLAMDDAILNGYTFDNINENKTIEVIFEVKTYVLESTVQGNGRASVVGVQMVEHGESLTVKFTPYVGYKVSQILVNGRALSGAELNNAIANGYTFDNINENKTIKVIFDIKTYVVTSVVGGKGSVNIVGNTTVTYGSSLKITFKPQVGYKVSKVIINGKELSGTRLNNIISKGYHVFSSIKQNCSIRIVFVKILPSINSSAVAVCF